LKFFTSEWWAGCQSGDGGDAITAFEAHSKAIRDRLTPELLALQERVSLHDASLFSLSVMPEKQMAVLTLKLADGSDLELRYAGLTAFESVQTPDQALGGPGGFGDLGYDEIDVLDDGAFEHRMLFSSSVELRFRFAGLELRPPATA
jgi:hypothetical protein